MRARKRCLTGALACCAAIAAPSHAAPQGDRQPAVVARDGAVALSALDDDDSLCLTVAQPEHDIGSSCSDPAEGIVVLGDEVDARHLGVAIAAPIARVEVRRAGRVLASGAAGSSPGYRGRYVASVRFALVRLPPRARTDALRIHAFDAAGTPVSVFAADYEDDLVFDRRRLLSGRSHGVLWSIVSSRASSLKPTVFDLAHESPSRCTEVSVQSLRGGGESSRSCRGEEPRDSLSFAGELGEPVTKDRCDPDFRLVHGVVAAAPRRVTVLLGDGRRVSARTALLPGGEYLAYAVEIGPDAAVRRVELRTRSGALEVRQVGRAPLTVTCAPRPNDTGSFLTATLGVYSPSRPGPPVTPRGPVSTLPGPPTVRIADGPGDALCIALGDRAFSAFGCALISPDLSEPLAVLDSFTKPRSFAFAFPARVATMRITGPNGSGTRDISTVAAAGYSGIYAPHVRFAAGTISSNRELGRVDLLDAAGKVLHSERTNVAALGGTPRLARPRRIAGRVGAPSLWQTRMSYASYRARCLALTAGPPPTQDAACGATRSDGAVLLAASCATRRLTVAIALTAGARVLADTGAATPRRVSLHDGAGLLTLAPGSPLRSLTIIRGRRTRRVRLDAPPGNRQCGWTATPQLDQR